MKDAFWFRHDSNARNDDKIIKLRTVYGTEGYGWYWMLVEILRDQPGYRYPQDKYIGNALALHLQCDASKADTFLKDCINEFNLFQSDGQYFWSESLVRRMEHWDNKSTQASKAAHVRWDKEKDADAMRSQCVSNANKSIEEKSIEEKKKPPISPLKGVTTEFIESIKPRFPTVDIETEWGDCQRYWTEHKRKMKAPQTALVNWLKGAKGGKTDGRIPTRYTRPEELE